MPLTPPMFDERLLPLRPAGPGGRRLRRSRVACAVAQAGLALAAQAQSQPAPSTEPAPKPAAASPAPQLRLDRERPAAQGSADGRRQPTLVEAGRIQVRPGSQVIADGMVEFRRGGVVLKADRIEYRYEDDLLRASGGVHVSREGAEYRGDALELQLDSFQGWFSSPRFDFTQIGAGGDAARIDFLGAQRARAWQARYTSCPRDQAGEPAWQLTSDRVDLDVEANEGRAEGAVLRFLGVPILAVPRLSFPITGERKSGWLPPSVNLDNRSGFHLAVPYYWNIAPNRDATITPRLLSRRGLGADLEFRYLEPRFEGVVGVDLLPDDRVAGRSRHAWRTQHQAQWDDRSGWLSGARAGWTAIGVSDDDWWKDFPRGTSSLTPRLLAQDFHAEKPLAGPGFSGEAYARLAHWQFLKSGDPVASPYQRSPQLGVRLQAELAAGLEASVESELNRFTIGRPDASDALRPTGVRWHATASVARPWSGQGWWVRPVLALNAAVYDTSGQGGASRVLPTVSLDAGAALERRLELLGRGFRQVLEPRAQYARTPYRDQSRLPNYDSAGMDFNITSIYSPNAWSGVDRISDTHHLTLGATTRLVRDSDGGEVLRLGLVQRMLLDPQRVTPDDADPSRQAASPLTRKLSDVLMVGSTQIVPRWTFEGTARFSADTQRAARSVLAARYVAPDFRALGVSYRFTRGQAEQIDLGWQWPLTARAAGRSAAAPGGESRGVAGSACSGRLYSVGRINYSMLDSRITDSLVGFEYDAGCWIGRIVAERVSTGRSEATTRLMLQLELVGLSRLGSNPLRVLKDNIAGYRLLRDEPGDQR
jgi:LPS-assembly protein